MARRLLLVFGLMLVACGCNRMNGSKSTWQQAANGSQQVEAQIADLKNRSSVLDANNQDLTKQLALSQQQSQVYKDQVAQYRKEIEHLAKDLKDTQVARVEAEKRVEAMQVSNQRRGGAIITANNSIRQSLGMVSIPGVEVHQEDNVVSIELPADELFRPGTQQLQPGGTALLDRVADAIARNYARQRIGVEGHMDSGSDTMATNTHQIAALQAMAVFDQLTQRNRIPSRQLFWVSHGSNHPRASNSTPAGRAKNRRVEVIIYPETVETGQP